MGVVINIYTVGALVMGGGGGGGRWCMMGWFRWFLACGSGLEGSVCGGRR